MQSQIDEILNELLYLTHADKVMLYNYQNHEDEIIKGEYSTEKLYNNNSFKDLWECIVKLRDHSKKDVNLVDFCFDDYNHYFKVINTSHLVHVVAESGSTNQGKIMAVLGLTKQKLENIL